MIFKDDERWLNKRIDEPTGTETVGHEWDGIEELDTPLPRWWLWTFYAMHRLRDRLCHRLSGDPACFTRGTAGVLGWTSRGQLAAGDERPSSRGRRRCATAIAATADRAAAGQSRS